MTLREGLEEYFAGHPGLTRIDSADSETAQFFHSHDACHVLFGLDTTLTDEGLADLWTIFGTDIGLRRYVAYLRADPVARRIVKEIGVIPTIATSLRLVPSGVQVLLRARRMKEKWQWGSEKRYLDWPLVKLRRQFKIEIL